MCCASSSSSCRLLSGKVLSLVHGKEEWVEWVIHPSWTISTFSSFLDHLPAPFKKKILRWLQWEGQGPFWGTHIPVQTSHVVSGGSWVQSCCNSTWPAEGCDGLQPEQLQLCALQPLPPRNKGWPSLGNKLNLQAQGCLGKLWALKNLKETFVTKFETKDFLGWIGIG